MTMDDEVELFERMVEGENHKRHKRRQGIKVQVTSSHGIDEA
jgi:hypothetical protein